MTGRKARIGKLGLGAGSFPLIGGSLAVVLVMAADPELPSLVLIAALRRPIEEPVVGHQELDPPTGRRVRLVDGPVLEREDGEAEQLGQVPVDVRAGRRGVAEATGGRLSSIGSIAFRVCSRLAEKPRSVLNSLS